MKTDFLFEKAQDDKLNFDEKELVELFPYGMSLNNDTARPFLILKDKSGENSLPVGLTQIEAGVTLSQTALQNQQAQSNTHSFLEKLLKSLDIKIVRCVFVEITGQYQFVRLFMLGHPQYESIKIRADEAMSLCLHLKVPLFATKGFMNKSKLMISEGASETAYRVQNSIMDQLGIDKKQMFH